MNKGSKPATVSSRFRGDRYADRISAADPYPRRTLTQRELQRRAIAPAFALATISFSTVGVSQGQEPHPRDTYSAKLRFTDKKGTQYNESLIFSSLHEYERRA
jgi:hypothetical protein